MVLDDNVVVYALDDAKNAWASMTKEQILAAITQAVNEGTISDIDAGFITKIRTVNGTALRFFVGTQAEYNELTEEQRQDLFAIITNDTTKDDIYSQISDLEYNLNTVSQIANNAKNTTDRILSGDLTVAKATNADNATNATNATKAAQDGDGNIIDESYLRKPGTVTAWAWNIAKPDDQFSSYGSDTLLEVAISGENFDTSDPEYNTFAYLGFVLLKHDMDMTVSPTAMLETSNYISHVSVRLLKTAMEGMFRWRIYIQANGSDTFTIPSASSAWTIKYRVISNNIAG